MNETVQLAFLDLETTGFSPKKGDRIVEVAIITTDWEGNVQDRFETLINPLRDVTGTEIHRLTAELLKEAPVFSEAVEDILFYLRDKVLVGHNVTFDLRFLEAELARHYGKQLLFQGMCTLKLSKTLFPTLPLRRLDALCEFLDIELSHAHSALADCEATREMFRRMQMLTADMDGFQWGDILTTSCCIDFNLTPRGIVVNRSKAQDQINTQKSQLFNFIKRLPADPQADVSVYQYLNLLDEVLADRKLTVSEVENMMDLISVLGLSRYQVQTIHKDYLKNLCRVYWKDRILSQAERWDLGVVSELLGVEPAILDLIIVKAEQQIKREQGAVALESCNEEIQGKSICFTGALKSTLNGARIDRSFAQKLAIEHGMIIKNGVSKSLDYLVTADPNSLSGKSLKAQEYGIKIIAEPVFWSWVSFKVD